MSSHIDIILLQIQSLTPVAIISGVARSQMTHGHCMHFEKKIILSAGAGGLTNAVGLESGVVLIHDFSIRARSTGLHRY